MVIGRNKRTEPAASKRLINEAGARGRMPRWSGWSENQAGAPKAKGREGSGAGIGGETANLEKARRLSVILPRGS